MRVPLLTNEEFVKSVTSVSDNLAGKYLLPSIREAQEQGLRGILGDALLDKLKEMVKDETLEGMYKNLVERSQYYLAYKAVIEVMNKVTYKVGNFGVAKSNDENLQTASYEENVKMQYYYESKADAYCLQLQNWILENRTAFPELSERQCNKIEANLHSSASCGIWLGGVRGKTSRRRR